MSHEAEFKADLEQVNKALQQLGDHFDSVQIFVSRHEPTRDGTVNIHKGTGNWFARFGQVSVWLIKTDEVTRYQECKAMEEEE